MIAIMECRSQLLAAALDGLKSTGVPLVSKCSGVLCASGTSDDLGIYWAIPRIAVLFDLPLEQAIDTFFISISIIAAVSGIFGFFCIFRSILARLVSAIGIIVAMKVAIFYGDVYIINAAVVVAFTPILLCISQRSDSRFNMPLLLFIGLVAGLSDQFRLHSGTGLMLIAVAFVILVFKCRMRLRAALLGSLIVGYAISNAYFINLLDTRDSYIKAAIPGYIPAERAHPVWHSIYIGLGFIENPYGIRYSDTVSMLKVKELSPEAKLYSEDYESALKGAVFDLARSDPHFMFSVIAAKLLVVMRFFAIFANLGVLVSIVFRKPWQHEVVFLGAALFYSLPGLLVLPTANYVSGLIAVAAVYGGYNIASVIDGHLHLRFGNPRKRKMVPANS